MRNPLRIGIVALVVSAGSLACLPVEAQQQPKSRQAVPVQPNQPGQPPDQSVYGPALSVQFGGGTLEEYLVSLQQAAGDKPVNVVTPAEAKKVVLPPITLREVTLYTALSAVSAGFENNSEHQFRVAPLGNQVDGSFSLLYERRTFDPRGGPFQQQGVAVEPRRLEVYSIRDLIEPPAVGDGAAKLKYEDILAAVEAAMELLEDPAPPRLMFHKETGLLMVAGTQYQTEIIDALIQRVRSDLQRRWSEERGAKKASGEGARRLAMAKTDIRIAEREVAAAEERYKQISQRVESGIASRDDLNIASLEYERAKGMLERKMIELEGMMEEIEAASQGAGRGAAVDPASAERTREMEKVREKAGRAK